MQLLCENLGALICAEYDSRLQRSLVVIVIVGGGGSGGARGHPDYVSHVSLSLILFSCPYRALFVHCDIRAMLIKCAISRLVVGNDG